MRQQHPNPNVSRTERVFRTLLANYNEGEPQENVIDILTDLMHYCPEYGVNFSEALTLAEDHYRDELTEDCEEYDT